MSDLCSMPYADSDNEYSDLWDERRVRARKRHRCDECGEHIQPGEVYGRAKGLADHSWSTWRRCAACLALAEWVATVTGECPLWGTLSMTLDDIGAEYSIPHPEEYRRQWDAGTAEAQP